MTERTSAGKAVVAIECPSCRSADVERQTIENFDRDTKEFVIAGVLYKCQECGYTAHKIDQVAITERFFEVLVKVETVYMVKMKASDSADAEDEATDLVDGLYFDLPAIQHPDVTEDECVEVQAIRVTEVEGEKYGKA